MRIVTGLVPIRARPRRERPALALVVHRRARGDRDRRLSLQVDAVRCVLAHGDSRASAAPRATAAARYLSPSLLRAGGRLLPPPGAAGGGVRRRAVQPSRRSGPRSSPTVYWWRLAAGDLVPVSLAPPTAPTLAAPAFGGSAASPWRSRCSCCSSPGRSWRAGVARGHRRLCRVQVLQSAPVQPRAPTEGTPGAELLEAVLAEGGTRTTIARPSPRKRGRTRTRPARCSGFRRDMTSGPRRRRLAASAALAGASALIVAASQTDGIRWRSGPSGGGQFETVAAAWLASRGRSTITVRAPSVRERCSTLVTPSSCRTSKCSSSGRTATGRETLHGVSALHGAVSMWLASRCRSRRPWTA
jgi:hypothetical protein